MVKRSLWDKDMALATGAALLYILPFALMFPYILYGAADMVPPDWTRDMVTTALILLFPCWWMATRLMKWPN